MTRWALAALLLTACDGGAPAPSGGPENDLEPSTGGNFSSRTYERSFVFASLDGDSLFMVPWLMETVQLPDSARRAATGWLSRGGIWEEFHEDRWTTPADRAPDRLLPHGSVSFVVRDGDAIDGIIYDADPRSLELVLGDAKANWVGPRGGVVEVLNGSVYLSDQLVEGTVLHMARASGQGMPAGGDWAFLISGDSAHFVLAAQAEHGGEAEPGYRGYAELDGSVLQWPEILVDWWDTQAFPPARRDVPVAWRVWTADGLIEGELEAVSADIRPGDGPGPLLPVRALFEVAGRLSTVEGTFEVRGLLVHERR